MGLNKKFSINWTISFCSSVFVQYVLMVLFNIFSHFLRNHKNIEQKEVEEVTKRYMKNG